MKFKIVQYICLYKEIALQSALYSFAVLNPSRCFEFEDENSFPFDTFSKTIFRQDENFLTF